MGGKGILEQRIFHTLILVAKRHLRVQYEERDDKEPTKRATREGQRILISFFLGTHVIYVAQYQLEQMMHSCSTFFP